MEVVILGSGTAIPSSRRGSPGLLISVDGEPLLFDPGATALWRLAEAGLDTHSVKTVCFSHLHPDHIGGLVPFLFAAVNPEAPRTAPLRLVGPDGLRAFYENLGVPYGAYARPSGYTIRVDEVGRDRFNAGAARIESRPVAHSDRAVAYRVESGGKAVVYSGDTDYCEGIVEISRGCDLLVLECALPEGRKVEGHLTPSWAGRIAAEAGVGRLVLTHFYPACEGEDLIGPVRERYEGEVLLAEDLMRVPV